ncbi:MAG: hypothetical protein ACXWPI_19590 [Ktedonobacterales bacterium]|jgi:hypothetical protein
MTADQHMELETTLVEAPLSGALGADSSRVWPVIGRGLLPLALMVVIGAVVVGLVLLVRLLVDPVRDFLLQEGLFAGIMISGLALVIITYIITTRRTLKRIHVWRERGQTAKVMAATVTLLVVAFVLVFPLLLALLLRVGV